MSSGINNIGGGSDLRSLELLQQQSVAEQQLDPLREQISADSTDVRPSAENQDDGEQVLLLGAEAADPTQRILLDGSVHVPSNISAADLLSEAVGNAAAFITADL